jgi:hypothetical protein
VTTTSSLEQTKSKRSIVDASRFDFSLLVGKELTLFSEQFPGKPLKSKVILASEGELSIDRSGGSGLIDNLVSNQKVTMRVNYKGQQINVPATMKRSDGGKCRIIIGNKVVPLSRRRFTRVCLSRPVKLAIIPVSTFNRNKLERLRWLETVTISISGGGVLIDFSSSLEKPSYLFLNIDLAEFSFPALVLGQLVYSLPRDDDHFNIGLEFIIREAGKKHFSLTTLNEFPQVVFQYGKQERIELNNKITAWMQDNRQH